MLPGFNGQCPGGICPIQPSQRPPIFSEDRQPAGPSASAQVPAQIVAASVKVSGAMGNGKFACGSGTCIGIDGGRAYVLTCKHVVEGCTSFTVAFPSGGTFGGQVAGVDEKVDLAMIAIAATANVPTVPVADTHPVRGMPVYQVGYPGGRGPRPQRGTVLGYYQPLGGYGHQGRNFTYTIKTQQGDSGSGIFLASENALCGVVWGGFGDPGQQMNDCGVELKDIRQFCIRFGIGFGRPPAGFMPTQPVAQQPVAPQPPATPYQPLLPLLPDKQAIADIVRKLQEIEKGMAGLKGGLEAVRGEMAAGPAKLKELEGGLGQLRGGLDAMKAGADAGLPKLQQLEKAIADLRAGHGNLQTSLLQSLDKLRAVDLGNVDLQAGHADLKDKVDGALGRVRSLLGDSGDVKAKLDGLLAKLPEIEAKAATVSAAAGALGAIPGPLQPFLLGIAAIGGVIGTGSAGASALRWLRGRVPGNDGAAMGAAIASVLRDAVKQAQQPTQPPGPVPSVIVRENPPPPQVVRHDSTYVPVEVPSKELKAFETALDELVKKYPGSQGFAETLQSFKNQLLAGQK